MTGEHIVICGFGPVSGALAQQLAPAAAAGRIKLTVIGAESEPAYNRVLLAEHAIGSVPAEHLRLVDPAALREQSVDVRLGVEVRGIDRARRVLHMDRGPVSYDRLVLATGARPVIPSLGGVNFDPHRDAALPDGVYALRTLDDARGLNRVLRTGGRVLILGGGVIGVEAALALAAAGHRPVLVQHSAYPLSRVLDPAAGALLTRLLREAGVELLCGVRACAVRKDAGRFTDLITESHGALHADALLLATGVRPRTELAAAAGLHTNVGICTDRSLAADSEGRIFAIGDCAEVAGQPPAGLLAPGWAQASWLAGHLLGGKDPAPNFGAPSVLTLKGQGIDVVAAGTTDHDPEVDTLVYSDTRLARYFKATVRRGVLEGFICVGLPRTGSEMALLFERGAQSPPDLSVMLRLDDPAGVETDSHIAASEEDQLCRCSGATRGEVETAIAQGCTTVEQVGRSCRAGTGCGTCREKIVDLLAQLQPAL